MTRKERHTKTYSKLSEPLEPETPFLPAATAPKVVKAIVTQ